MDAQKKVLARLKRLGMDNSLGGDLLVLFGVPRRCETTKCLSFEMYGAIVSSFGVALCVSLFPHPHAATSRTCQSSTLCPSWSAGAGGVCGKPGTA